MLYQLHLVFRVLLHLLIIAMMCKKKYYKYSHAQSKHKFLLRFRTKFY